MRYLGRVARVTALTMVAMAVTGGVAGATSHGSSPAVRGTVTSVNGDTTTGACGTADADGTFTVLKADTSTTTTVDVSGATTFEEHKVASATFANVCVGDRSVVVGSNVDSVMTASAVTVHQVPVPKVHVYGTVTAVNGDQTSTACGTAGATGDFTLSTVEGETTVVNTVDVDGSTLFTLHKVTDPTFANVCVGDRAVALGPQSDDGAILATVVGIKPPKPVKPPKTLHETGYVTSIDGVSTAGTCGTAGDAGTFTAAKKSSGLTFTVNVTAGTSFDEANVAGATFADVCVGGKTVSIGTTTDGALNAVAVAAWAPKTPKG